LPEVPELRANPETGTPAGEYAVAAVYYVYHNNGVERVKVEIDMSQKVPDKVSLGTYNFNETEAEVFLWGLTEEEADSGKHIVADAVCFGDCPAGISDITPPEIKNAKAINLGSKFLIQVDVTDSGSGVGNVYLSFNGEIWPMTGNGGDTYSVQVPSIEGINLDYFVIAYDKAGNEAIWSPTLGYVTRGAGLNIGVPPEAARFVNFKKNYYNRVLPAKAGVDPCSQCAGDPVNTQNGNLVEQVELAKISGRPEINFNIQYNSQGGTVGIFGESWTHSYNYKVLEFDSASFQGVYVTYPGGNTQEFKREGGNFVATNPFLTDTLTKEGGQLVLKLANQTKIKFDSFGDVAVIENLAGEKLTFTYTNQDLAINFSKLLEISADGGRKLKFAYTGEGLVSEITLPNNKKITLGYSGEHDLISVTNENGNEIKFDYQDHTIVKKYSPEGHTYYTNEADAKRRITKQIAGDNFVQNFEYQEGKTIVRDANGTVAEYQYKDNLIQNNVDEVGDQTKFEYDDKKRIIAETDAEGNRTEYAYDDRGNQTMVKHADGSVTKREFNERNQITRLEDHGSDAVSTYEYDTNGNLIKATDAIGAVSQFEYNGQNQLTKVTDAKGNSEYFSYNAQGDLTKHVDRIGAVTEYLYDDLGRKVAEVNALGNITSFHYDDVGNLIRVEAPLGATEHYEYDKNNRLIKATNANGAETRYEYDAKENLVSVTDALGNKKTMTYGQMNELLTEVNEEGITTKHVYTPDYRVSKVVAAAGKIDASTSYSYNKFNGVSQMVDAEGRVTKLEYNSVRRLVRVVADANGIAASEATTYNPRGKVTSKTDAEGRTTRYELDALDRAVKVIDALGGETVIVYDSVGNKVSQIDANGNVTKFEYDANNRVVKQINAHGDVATFKYDLLGNIVEAANFNQVATAYQYDALNRLVKEVKNPESDIVNGILASPGEIDVATQYEYDKVGNLTKQVNPRGYITHFNYDALNRLTEIVDAYGNTTKMAYNKLGELVSVTDRNGNTTKTNYDALQREIEIINAKNDSVRKQYDKVGNLLKETDARGNSTNFGYNGLNQRVQIVDALGGNTRYAYDKVGNVLKKTDANGHATQYSYDKLNRLVAEINPEGHKVTTAYDKNGNNVAKVDANGNATNYEYDKLNRLVKEINALGGVKQYTYDPVGNLLQYSDANTHVDVFAYDPLNRVVSETDAEGNTRKREYDANSNLTKVIDANGNPIGFEFDSIDRLVLEVNALNEVTAYEYDKETNITAEIAADLVKTAYAYDSTYLLTRVTLNAQQGENNAGGAKDANTNVDTAYKYDANGNLIGMIDPKGYSTNFAYDALNRQVRETNALGNSWLFGYDAVGNRVARTDANGQLTQYGYYPDNMLRAIQYAGKYIVTYSYDKNNNVTQIVDQLGTSTFAYDALNRQTKTKDALNRNLGLAYDQEQNVTKVTYPDGKVVSYGYLKNDWMSQMTSPDGKTTSYEYDRVGNNTRIRNPNNTQSTYTYDALNRVKSIINASASATNTNIFYTYNNVGQRTKVEKTYGWQQPASAVHTYEYDPIRRLTASTEASDRGSIVNYYAYDRNSNRVTWNSSDNTNTPRPFDKTDLVYEYNQVNQILRITQKENVPTPQNTSITSSSSSVSSSSSTTTSSSSSASFTTVTKPKPVVVNQFIDGLRNFQNELQVQKGKQITDKAYTDLWNQLQNLLKKAESGLLNRSEGNKLVEQLRNSIKAYAASKDIKTPGIENSLLVKLDGVNVNLLPVTIPTTTEQVPVSNSNPSKPGNTPAAAKPGQQPKPERDPKTVKEILFTYDRNGNRISKLIDGPQGPEDQLTLYSYDPENRLTKVVNQERGNTNNSWNVRDTSALQYDALGRRLVKEYEKKRTEYTYLNFDPIAEHDIQKSHITQLYRGINNRIASAHTFTTDGVQDPNYLHYDALDSVVGITNSVGQSNKNIRYNDFGELQDNNTQRSDSTGGTTMDPHGHYAYTGQEWDERMEVYEFHARAYDPVHGVWLQQDPYRGEPKLPQTKHRYMYVFQSPLNYKDPYGKCPWCIPLALIVLVVIDIGWDAIEVHNANQVINNPDSTAEQKREAQDDIMLIVATEALEPEQLCGGLSLPIDNVGRLIYKQVKKSATKEVAQEVTEKAVKEGVEEIQEQGTKQAAKNLASKLDDAFKKIDANKISHILQDKHLWSKVVKDPKNWGEVSGVMRKVMEEGTEEAYKGVYKKSLKIGDEIVEVTYNKTDDVIQISDGWVVP
jgi:RHS repeat-associated protein